MTNEQHNKYLGVAFLVHGGIQLLFMLLMAVMFALFFASIPSRPGEPGPPPFFFLPFIGFIVVFQSIFTIPAFVAAYALLKRKSWARLGVIIAAVLSAMSVPIGTAVCVYALWFFFGENWKEVYQPALAQTGGARSHLPGQADTADAAAWTVNQSREPSRDYAPPPPPPDWR
jgi:hypothetical protein